MKTSLLSLGLLLSTALPAAHAAAPKPPTNVLFIISDDLTATALSCYGNTVCKTPNIDRLAKEGTRFTRAYCQATFCGPSRASFMTGYYPQATGLYGYGPCRNAIGPHRSTWSQHFIKNGYEAVRVSKIYHMGVPIGIEKGTDGSDDPASWSRKFNSQGPEWRAPGTGETLEGNPEGKRPVVGGNTFVVVEADGDDLVHSDGKTAAKAVELINGFADQPFFLAVGFVRPHVPFVAPRPYYTDFLPYDSMVLPEKVKDDQKDIPPLGINYKTSAGMKMDIRRQKKAVGGYYASVAYMDAQVGKVLDALEQSGKRESTIVIFTSDHGYHLGEHDFWAKVSLHEESAAVPLIIAVPGKEPAVCNSLVELLDLYPTVAALCGLPVPPTIQGKNIAELFDAPSQTVHEEVLCTSGGFGGTLLRTDRYAYMRYKKKNQTGEELYDMQTDPKQFTNLIDHPEYAGTLATLRKRLDAKLAEVQKNDL